MDRVNRLFGRRKPAGTAAKPGSVKSSSVKSSSVKSSSVKTGSVKAGARLGPKPAPRGRHLEYAPDLDGRADPGEIVWTWVTFEDDASQGKDRPVLVVGRDGATLLGLMLSSEAKRDGQHNWFALGTGAWDGEHRPSWLRLDRVLEVHENSIRREGAILDRQRFEKVAGILRSSYGWH
jgi:PemK-like, MazF-like toxin of type II toxin-antitoxin system